MHLCFSDLNSLWGTGVYFTAIMLISTFTNFGNADTCTVSLAGKLLLLSKYFPYTSLISENRFMSVIKIVVFTTLWKVMSAAVSIARRLCITWWVSCCMS